MIQESLLIQVFLNEVESDKKQGDPDAAAAGAKVLQYYLEFSRDAKKNKKVIRGRFPQVTEVTLMNRRPALTFLCSLSLQYLGPNNTLAPPNASTQWHLTPLTEPDDDTSPGPRPRSKSECE